MNMPRSAENTHSTPQAVQHRRPFSTAERTGFAAFLLSALLWILNPYLAVIPLAGFIIACLALPFVPQASFFLPVISRGRALQNGVCLTFDDGPNPISTPALLKLLKKNGATATFFVNGFRAHNHPDIIRQILADGHGIGNHSYTHDEYIMFRSVARLKDEILRTQQALEEFGYSIQFFRPPVGIVTSRYTDALYGTGLQTVNFSRRAYDLGNRRITDLSKRLLKNLRAGEILLLHDIPPRKSGSVEAWLAEVECIVNGIREQGLEIVSLDSLID
jgi:peptidoglycan/xylan/chitin deacetylase (PgdA/CDA1 family)